MIQRIQSIYLLISIVCLSVLAFGTPIFYFIGTKIFEFSAAGIYDISPAAAGATVRSFPLNIFIFVLIAFILFTIFQFKNLKRQAAFVRIATILYAILFFGLLGYYLYFDQPIKDEHTTTQLGIGFFVLAIGLPALILANNGIKRDKKLIDSLNRLR